MPCYHPLMGYRSKSVNPDTKKRNIVFNRNQGLVDQKVQVPCGQCIGCRLERSRQWAIRCLKEAKMYEANCFITLTYDDEHLPENGSLVLEDFQKFMKRLRKKFGEGIRFFHCGEYGDRYGRPHYHACIFNLDFKDKKLLRVERDQKYYISESLSELWDKGHHIIGDVTFDSAAYVARYITKKQNGVNATKAYCEVNKETGEIIQIKKPEYTTMSRRPGIGTKWFKKYMYDVYPDDFMIINGKKIKPPKFYDGKFEIENNKMYNLIKGKRKKLQELKKEDNTLKRLAVKESCKKYQTKTLKRSLENGNTQGIHGL